MYETWERLDVYILAFYTKISHKFQRFAGRTNFFLAKCALVVFGSCALIQIGNYWLTLLNDKTNPFIVFCCLLALAGISMDLNTCDTADEDALLSEKRRKYDFASFRAIFKPASLIGAIIQSTDIYAYISKPGGMIFFEIAYHLLFLSLLSFCYFIEVDPLPPGKSKVQEWAENIPASFKKLVPLKTSP